MRVQTHSHTPFSADIVGVMSPALLLLLASLCLAGASPPTLPYPRSLRPTGSEPLQVIADGALAPEDVVTLETLAGFLARDTPQIYRCSPSLSLSLALT